MVACGLLVCVVMSTTSKSPRKVLRVAYLSANPFRKRKADPISGGQVNPKQKNPPQEVGPEGAVEKRGEKRAISF